MGTVGFWKKIRNCRKCGEFVRSQAKTGLCRKCSAIENLKKTPSHKGVKKQDE